MIACSVSRFILLTKILQVTTKSSAKRGLRLAAKKQRASSLGDQPPYLSKSEPLRLDTYSPSPSTITIDSSVNFFTTCSISIIGSSCLVEEELRSMSLALAMAPALVTLPTNSNGTSKPTTDDPSHCRPRSPSIPACLLTPPYRKRAASLPVPSYRIRRASQRPTGSHFLSSV